MPRHACTRAATASILLALAIPAHAQLVSHLFITADAQTTVSVLPGTPVRLAVAINHNAFSVAGFQGSVLVTDNVGTASNFSTLLPSLPTIALGGFFGGSRTGVDVAFTPPGFIGGPTFPSAMNPMPVFEYDLTFDEPGVYEVNWVAAPAAPNVRLYSSVSPWGPYPVPSTYAGATIIVIPAPSAAALLLLPILTPRRRRGS